MHLDLRVTGMVYKKERPFDCTNFMKFLSITALRERIACKFKSHNRQEEGTVMSYCEDLNYLPKRYATDDEIVETDADMMQIQSTVE